MRHSRHAITTALEHLHDAAQDVLDDGPMPHLMNRLDAAVETANQIINDETEPVARMNDLATRDRIVS